MILVTAESSDLLCEDAGQEKVNRHLSRLSSVTELITTYIQTIRSVNLSVDPSEAHSAASNHNHCHSDIRDWMAANFLKLNDETTELRLISHPKHLAKVTDFTYIHTFFSVR